MRLARTPSGVINKSGSYGYICNGYWYINHLGKVELVHRLIMKLKGHNIDGKIVDHRDGNGLNNADDNLRITDSFGNNQNCITKSNNTSGHKGVNVDKRTGRLFVTCQVNGKYKKFGYYGKDEFELACLVADEVRSKYYGQYAK